jgi:hypothetical protein
VIGALLDSPGANSFPIPFLVTWGFSVKPDCYEPNDTCEEAATIMIGEEVEAYLLKNRGSVQHQAAAELEDQHTDWYEFTLDTSSALTVDIAKLPSDVTARFAVHNSLEQAIPGAEWIQPNDETSGSLVLPSLPEGDYYLSVTVVDFDEGSESAKNDEPLPDHFVTPYRFQLTIPTFPTNGMCYVPTAFMNALANRWLDPGDDKIEQITAPADPGGGIFEVEIKTVEDSTGRRVLPGMQVRIPGVGTSVAGDNPADGITKVAFETGPAQTFNVHVEIANSPAARGTECTNGHEHDLQDVRRQLGSGW